MSAHAGPDRLLQRLLGTLGLPRTVKVDRVTYRERSAEPLSRALSSKGTGSKDYEVRFPDAERMLIRCTRTRVYDDLVGDRTPTSIRAIEPVVRPGMRVLVCPGGTGALGARVARLVGPSGAVVSLEGDDESVQFATRRYPLSNVAYEKGKTRDIGGETNGAFDAAIIAFSDETEEQAAGALAEALRIVQGGGWVLVRAEGRVVDDSGRGVAADNRALVRHAIEAAAGEDSGAPASNRIDALRWLEEPTGTPAVLISLRSDLPFHRSDLDDEFSDD